jgi:16S rRNA C967 or C1407 C5-methylase (RsmB/RsmF family)
MTDARGGGNGSAGKWRELRLESALYEEYYSKVGVVPAGEFDAFMAALRTPLPTTFRVTRASYMCAAVLSHLERIAADMTAHPVILSPDPDTPTTTATATTEVTTTATTVMVPPPRPIPWYPWRSAWHLAAGRRQLRKSEVLGELHRFLVAQNEQGSITRQEAVSMIPPLLLDVRPASRILDMCAAPGSKTTELVELLHAAATVHSPGSLGLPDGFVVANELDLDRSFMLVHQTKKMASPNFLITCSDAEKYPRVAPNGVAFDFDRVLCDVPCSGDGTLRKNPDLWARWHPKMAHRQHRLQLGIARRGLALLRPGGRLVYSTCSMNPVEDEAVVAELIRSSNGTVALVDVSKELPELKRMSGVSDWLVFHDPGCWAKTHAELPPQKREKIAPTCFPPTPEEAATLHLDRCMRLLPHH